jgi:hypothetical protein
MGKLFKLFLLIAVIALSGCGEEPLTISKITVTPSPATVGINKSLRFAATAYSQNNRIVPVTFTWSVTTSLGTIDSSGMFYAGGSELSGSVTATAQGISGSATVSTTTKGSVSGTIRNSQGGVVSGIKVYLAASQTVSNISDATGKYTLSNITPGTWEIMAAENATYLSTSIEVFVATAEAASGNIMLFDRLSILSESFQGTPITSVTGIVGNNGSTTAKSVTVTYTFYDIDGSILSTAIGTAGDIPPLGKLTFSALLASPIDSFASDQRTVSAGSY